MKKGIKTILAATLAVALAVPMTAAPVGNAKEKTPTLSPGDTAVIYTGKTKTFTIKNVKKANVKSLSVSVANKKAAKLVSKTKTSFKIKALAPHASAVDVTLKLKKKIAGKKTYKYELIVATGTKDAPDVVLSDGLTNYASDASVFKEGEAPAEWGDDCIKLSILNLDEISTRNLGEITWTDDGVKVKDSCVSADFMSFRPDTSLVVNTDVGFDSGKVKCEVENSLSLKKGETEEKEYRVVTQAYIDKATSDLRSFASKYPYNSVNDMQVHFSESDDFETDFYEMVLPYSNVMGTTLKTVSLFKDIIDSFEDEESQEAYASLSAAIDDYKDKCLLVANNLGTEASDATTFCDYLKAFTIKCFNDEKNAEAQVPPSNDNYNKITIKFSQKCPVVSRIKCVARKDKKEFTTSGCAINESDTMDIYVPEGDTYDVYYQIWFFGYPEGLTYSLRSYTKNNGNLSIESKFIDLGASDIIVTPDKGGKFTLHLHDRPMSPDY